MVNLKRLLVFIVTVKGLPLNLAFITYPVMQLLGQPKHSSFHFSAKAYF